MRSSSSPWSLLRSSFVRQIQSGRFRSRFDALRRADPVVGLFSSPDSLVAHQHSKLPSHDAHDQVIHALVLTARSGSRHHDVAGPLLFLSLYPGLSGVYGKVFRLYDADAAADASGDVVLAFFQQVDRWPAEKTERIAATLKLNTLRTVMRQRRKALRDRERVQGVLSYAEIMQSVDYDGKVPADEITAAAMWQSLASRDRPYSLDDPEIEDLIERLVVDFDVRMDDAVLLALRGPCQLSWTAVGEVIGAKPATARKRHQRLLEKLRCQFVVTSVCPDLDAGMCVFRVRDNNADMSKE